MLLGLKKINLEYFGIIMLAIAAGFLISFYNLSVLFALASILFIIISFKYFNQVLFLLVLYIPFQIALNAAPGIDLASGRVLILYLFAVWIMKSLAEKRFVIRLNLQTLLILLFLFMAAFSILQAWDTERAFRKILVFISIFPLYFIVTSFSIPSLGKEGLGVVENKKLPLFPSLGKEGLGVVENKKLPLFPSLGKEGLGLGENIENKNNYIYKILDALLISGFVLALIGIAQFLLQFIVGINPIMNFWSKFIAPIFYGNTFGAEVVSNPSWLVSINGATIMRAFSLFPDPHMFSFYLGFLIPIVLATVLCGKNKNSSAVKIKMGSFIVFNNGLLYITLFVMLLAELLTFSRGGYIGMIAGIGATVILLWRYIGLNKKIILGLAAGVLISFMLFSNQSVVSRFLSSFDFSEGSNVERIKNWRQGWEMFSDNLFTGVGIGNYSIYLYPTAEYRTPIYAHNLYLDIGAEMGIFALIIWLVLITITVWQLYKASGRSDNMRIRALTVGLIGSLVWFSVHSFFDTPIYSPTILAMFMVIISLSVLSIKSSG
jgi:O-antigen ligase